MSLRERMGQLFSEKEFIVSAEKYSAVRVAKFSENDKNEQVYVFWRKSCKLCKTNIVVL
jgi:hypothetical protein